MKVISSLFFVIIVLCYACINDNNNPYGLHLNEFPVMDYDSMMVYRNDRPVFVSFNSIGCVNCRKLEKEIIASDSLLKALNEKFFFVNLYVDDRGEMKDSTRWRQGRSGKVLKRKAAIHSEIQWELTKTGSQPVLCILGDSLELLHKYSYHNRNELYTKIYVQDKKDIWAHFSNGRLGSPL